MLIFFCSGRPPKLASGLLNWIGIVWATSESFILTTVGLDAVMLLRFLKMSCILFTFLSVLGMSVLVPINYSAHRPIYTPGTHSIHIPIVIDT